MCLGIPGQIVEIIDPDIALALVSISGVRRQVNLSCVLSDGDDPTALIGRWTLVHVGFAMSLIDEVEAQRTLDLLQELGELQHELESINSDQ